MSGERTLDGRLDASPGTYSWGWLIAPDDSARLCEATGGSNGPYGHFTYRFVDCDSGVEFTVTANDRPHRWRPITRDRLIAETGLDPGPFRDGNMNWHGAWYTKERRNPVMRALYGFCLENAIACGYFELQSVILIRDPETASTYPRCNNTREFGSDVADRYDANRAGGLVAAIQAQVYEDIRLALAIPAMSCAWRDVLDFSGDRPLNLWSGRLGMTVRVNQLIEAAGIPRLLACCGELVESTRDEIEREREHAIAEATGNRQPGLFTEQRQITRRVAARLRTATPADAAADQQSALF